MTALSKPAGAAIAAGDDVQPLFSIQVTFMAAPRIGGNHQRSELRVVVKTGDAAPAGMSGIEIPARPAQSETNIGTAAPSRRPGQGRAGGGIRDAGLRPWYVWFARQPDEHHAVAGKGTTTARCRCRKSAATRLSRSMRWRAPTERRPSDCELDALQIADVVAIEVDQIGAGLRDLAANQRQRGNSGSASAVPCVSAGGAAGSTRWHRLQVAQLSSSASTCAVFQRGGRASWEWDPASSDAVGAQGVGDGGHESASGMVEPPRPEEGPERRAVSLDRGAWVRRPEPK